MKSKQLVKGKELITVTFEDHGQDFLEWEIRDGVVIGVWPFQAGVWCNSRVLNKPMIGGHLEIRSKHAVGKMMVNYPIEKIRLGGRTRAECRNDPIKLNIKKEK